MLPVFIKKIFRRTPESQQRRFITIVSGLPRSGTSMMMNMLELGGLPPMTDNLRAADPDNPKGYYEYERVKQLPDGDSEWLQDAEGRTLKIISALLHYLPTTYRYRIIFMERAVEEVLASQKKMLLRRGEVHDSVSDEELAAMFRKHLRQTEDWLREHQAHVSCLKVSYNAILKEPGPIIRQINRFLGGNLDIAAMESVVDPALYRNRREGFRTT
ncbi:MAG: hypothetical protein QTN59_06930 [Candidatus Electrothrix communis]|nr:hypothetical protein [Desulfobulbus sp. US4]WLE98565.1 MAG: hypothetical protein QTN59_06930 [Candidatus Electrothrix communis]